MKKLIILRRDIKSIVSDICAAVLNDYFHSFFQRNRLLEIIHLPTAD